MFCQSMDSAQHGWHLRFPLPKCAVHSDLQSPGTAPAMISAFAKPPATPGSTNARASALPTASNRCRSVLKAVARSALLPCCPAWQPANGHCYNA